MQRINDINLKNSLNKLRHLYYVVGDDIYLIDSCIKQICRAALGSSTNILHYRQKTLADGSFEELFMSISMMPENRAAIIDDFNANTLTPELRDFLYPLLQSIPNDLTVILRQHKDDRRTSTKKAEELVNQVIDSAMCTVSAKVGMELERYVKDLAKLENCEIRDKAVEELTTLCGSDLQLLENEIKKLAAYSTYTTITSAHVAALSVRTAETGVFKMISFMQNGNTAEALKLLSEMLDDQEEPLRIAAVMNTTFLNLYRSLLCQESKRGQQWLFDNFTYKKSDRGLDFAWRQCKNYTIRKLERIMNLLYELEKKLKSSAIDNRYIIEQKIIEISLALAS